MEWLVVVGVLMVGWLVFASAKKQEQAQERRFDAANFEIEIFHDEDGAAYYQFDLNSMRMEYRAWSTSATCEVRRQFVLSRDNGRWWARQTDESFGRQLADTRTLATDAATSPSAAIAARHLVEMERKGNQWEEFSFEDTASIEAHFYRHMRGG